MNGEAIVERDEVARPQARHRRRNRASQPAGRFRKIRASTPWRNGSAAFCCPRSTMMLAWTMRRTSPRWHGPSRHAIVVPGICRAGSRAA
ncbi:hypothetical protein LN650_21435 [Klebsiella pneumoniae subsp. pneumoniae]|nr:hypothetical protein [Klebsiella pneumoniae subsp. pneumoniae]